MLVDCSSGTPVFKNLITLASNGGGGNAVNGNWLFFTDSSSSKFYVSDRTNLQTANINANYSLQFSCSLCVYSNNRIYLGGSNGVEIWNVTNPLSAFRESSTTTITLDTMFMSNGFVVGTKNSSNKLYMFRDLNNVFTFNLTVPNYFYNSDESKRLLFGCVNGASLALLTY